MSSTKKIIDHIDYDLVTGLPFIVDCQGEKYLMTMVPRNYNRVYLKAYDRGPWPNITSFHAISCDMCEGAHSLDYTVPSDKRFYLAFLMAAQESNNLQRDTGVSLLGMFLNGSPTPSLFVPFSRELHYVLFEPIRFFENTHIEIKFKPYEKNAILGILVGGYLRDPDENY
jgi:hypothetical protein